MSKKKTSSKSLCNHDWVLDAKIYRSEWVRKEPLYLEKKDNRYKSAKKQLKEKGFCESETWALDSVICKFILPRLIRFREIDAGYPGGGDMTPEKWNVIVDKMIFAFDWSLNCEEDKYEKLTDEEKEENWKRYEEGMQLFAKWFRHLWW